MSYPSDSHKVSSKYLLIQFVLLAFYVRFWGFAVESVPDYTTYYQQVLQSELDTFGWPDTNNLKARRPVFFLDSANLAMRLWLKTHDPKYLVIAEILFEKGINWAVKTKSQSHENNMNNSDCFLLNPLMVTARHFKQTKNWNGKWDEDFAICIEDGMDYICGKLNNSPGNRVIDPMVGGAAMFNITNNDRLKKRLTNYWNWLLTIGDLDENSGNYSSLGINAMIDLAIELGKENDFMDARFKNTFARYRSMVSPSGFMPEWGDDYFKISPKMAWVYIFEFAAQLYRDPLFSSAARKLFSSNMARLEEYSACSDSALVSLKLHLNSSTQLENASEVTYRNTLSKTKYDKLILRTGHNPGDAMVMLDLYAWGEHSHADKRASIGYFEYGDTPLFYNYQRYLQSSSYANQVFIDAPSPTFPHADGWKPNVWKTFSIPSDRMSRVKGDVSGELRGINSMSFRNNPDKSTKDCIMYIDNIRLEGPQGVVLIEDFEKYDPKNRKHSWWGGDPSNIDLASNCTSGNTALRFKLAKSTGLNSPSVPYNISYLPFDYPVLKYDSMYQGSSAPSVQFRTFGDEDGLMSWNYINQPTLLCEVEDVKIEQMSKDVWSKIKYKIYGTYDSSASREIFLSEEGILFVHDEILPGNQMLGREGGPLWQMYSCIEKGKQFFSSSGEIPIKQINGEGYGNYGMTVWFKPQMNHEAGLSLVPQRKQSNLWKIQNDQFLRTAYSKTLLIPGAKSHFYTLVIPHKSYYKGSNFAERITYTGNIYSVEVPGKKVTFNVNSRKIYRMNVDNYSLFEFRPTYISSKSVITSGNANLCKEGFIEKWIDGKLLFPVEIAQPGSYLFSIEQASNQRADSAYEICIGGKCINSKIIDTKGVFSFVPSGNVNISKVGWQYIELRPLDTKRTPLLKIKSISLKKNI